MLSIEVDDDFVSTALIMTDMVDRAVLILLYLLASSMLVRPNWIRSRKAFGRLPPKT